MKKDYIENIEGAERRFFTPNISYREEGEDGIVEGLAAVVNKSTDLGWHEERIERGAFDDVLNDDVVALFNHDPNFPLARSNKGKGTLELFITKEGDLGYRYKTPDISYAKDLLVAIRSEIVTKSSFAFTIKEEEWRWADDENKQDKDIRVIKKLSRLYDVSPVTYPAYPDTSVAARSAERVKPKTNFLQQRKQLFNRKFKIQ